MFDQHATAVVDLKLFVHSGFGEGGWWGDLHVPDSQDSVKLKPYKSIEGIFNKMTNNIWIVTWKPTNSDLF